VAQKKLSNDLEAKRAMIEPQHPELSVRRQCELVGLNRATFYYTPAQGSPLNLQLMRLIDEQYTRTPFYGWPRMTAYLCRKGYDVNHKRVRRLMRLMGLQVICTKLRTTVAAKAHPGYLYTLRGLSITQPTCGEAEKALRNSYLL
jgi:putative transposase